MESHRIITRSAASSFAADPLTPRLLLLRWLHGCRRGSLDPLPRRQRRPSSSSLVAALLSATNPSPLWISPKHAASSGPGAASSNPASPASVPRSRPWTRQAPYQAPRAPIRPPLRRAVASPLDQAPDARLSRSRPGSVPGAAISTDLRPPDLKLGNLLVAADFNTKFVSCICSCTPSSSRELATARRALCAAAS